MEKRAVWRKRPEDPHGALGWLMDDRSGRWMPVPLALLITVALGALTVAWSPAALLALPYVALHVRRPARPIADLLPLATVPPPGPAYVCRIEVRDKGPEEIGATIGEDEGIVTFVSGWLHFVGRRTEFSLRKTDAQGYSSLRNVRLVDLGGETLVLAARAGWDATGRLDEAEADRFAQAFGVWFHSPCVADGRSVLPPREVHPSGLARAWRELVGCAATWGIFVAGMAAFFHSHVLIFAFSFGSIGPALTRLRDLHRRARARRISLSNETTSAFGP